MNGDKITDEVVISNEFCSYFTNIGKQYADAIPTSSKTPKAYLGNAPNPSTMYLTPTGPNEIISIIKSFQTKKSTGDDGISMQLLKQLCDSCSVPIANIINMSLHQGIMPDAMKLARVIPIYKAKSRDSFTNYRPISLLSNLSKVLEKVVYKRLYSFLTHNKILYDRQYGFRPARSTIDAITEFTTDVLPCLDKKEKCISVYLDLSKAFDTINHNIMLSKLEYYGIRGKALEWFKSYLANRRQYVDYRGTHSEIKQIEYGVPQGSVLGPLLFIIYSNDIPHSITYCKTILFADDTTVYLTHVDPHILYRHVNHDLQILNDWFKANQLSVNPSKTFILFSRGGDRTAHDLSIYINDEKLEQVQTTKFLGLYIDEKLSWEYHIEHCKSKVSKGVYAINSSKHILSQRHLKILYYSLIHPHLLYGIRLWGNAYQKYICRLEIAQKKAIRAIAGANYNATSSPLFKKLNILKFKDLYDLQIKQFVYEFVNMTLPNPLLATYTYHGDRHEHNTRHNTDPRSPSVNSNVMRRSFLYMGPILWMNLDDQVKSSKSKTIFKRKITQNYLRNY